MHGFQFEDLGEAVGVEPGWGHDVGAFLPFEQAGEPEGEVGALGRDQGVGGTLMVYICEFEEFGTTRKGSLAPKLPSSCGAGRGWRRRDLLLVSPAVPDVGAG